MKHSIHPHAHSQDPRNLRRRGSALLLAVVIVVLMTMMGAAYLQVARTDRRTSLDVDTRANVDNASILRYIAQILGGDVPITPGEDTPEPYDFPWTNPNPAAAGEDFVVYDRFSPVPVPGPQPDYNSANNNQFARPPRADGRPARRGRRRPVRPLRWGRRSLAGVERAGDDLTHRRHMAAHHESDGRVPRPAGRRDRTARRSRSSTTGRRRLDLPEPVPLGHARRTGSTQRCRVGSGQRLEPHARA